MSMTNEEGIEGGTPPPQSFDEPIGAFGSSLFAQVVEAVSGSSTLEAAAEGAGETGTPAAGGGQDPAGAEGAGDPNALGGADSQRAGREQGVPGGAPAADGWTPPSAWTVDAETVIPQLGDIANKFEERTNLLYQNEEFEEVKKEFPDYFDLIGQHPRQLVGKAVPKLDGSEGVETLRSAEDAREWQGAAKHLISQETMSRATKRFDENKDFVQTVHASISLFRDNTDLIPGTKQFDKDLAEEFVKLAKPYELKIDGKLHGYTIPVQPLINQIRQDLSSRRAAAPPPAPAAAPAAGSTPPPPQAGVPSKAGSSGGGGTDYSALFGTLGIRL